MNIADPILGVLFVLVFAVVVVALTLRLIPEGIELPIVLGGDPPWPRGVQEEEPVRYRLELLGSARQSELATRPSPRSTYVRRPSPTA